MSKINMLAKTVIVISAILITVTNSREISHREHSGSFREDTGKNEKRPMELLFERTRTEKEFDQSLLGTKPLTQIIRDILLQSIPEEVSRNVVTREQLEQPALDITEPNSIGLEPLSKEYGRKRRSPPLREMVTPIGSVLSQSPMSSWSKPGHSHQQQPHRRPQQQQQIFDSRHPSLYSSQLSEDPFYLQSEPLPQQSHHEHHNQGYESTGMIQLTEHEEAMVENILEHLSKDDPKPLLDFLGLKPEDIYKPSTHVPSQHPHGQSSNHGTETSGENLVPKSRNSRNRATVHDSTGSIQALLEMYKIQMKKSKREGPQLSVVSPLDVLRQQLIYELARRRLKESQDQIQVNSDLLKSLGRRRRSMEEETSSRNIGFRSSNPHPIDTYQRVDFLPRGGERIEETSGMKNGFVLNKNPRSILGVQRLRKQETDQRQSADHQQSTGNGNGRQSGKR